MTRVAVIGNASGGKSTMCRQLSLALTIPFYPIDRIQAFFSRLPGQIPAWSDDPLSH